MAFLASMAKTQVNQNPSLPLLQLGTRESGLDKIDLIQIQRDSWKNFEDVLLRKTIQGFFPIDDYTGKKFTLSFMDLSFGKPRYEIDLCKKKKLTYDRPAYIKLQLNNKRANEVKVQDVYLCNLPIMTDRGTFIINGIERAVISQIVRSPGVYFTAEIDKSTGLTLYNAEIRPYIGAWLDFTINKQGVIEAKINRKRKMLATVFLKLFDGDDHSTIRSFFQDIDQELVEKYLMPTLKKDRTHSREDAVMEFYRKVKPGEPLVVENAYKTLNMVFFDPKRYTLGEVGRYKVNKRLGLDVENIPENHLLSKQDVIQALKTLLLISKHQQGFDDIDHLGNRRLRTVGEIVSLYSIRVGMVRAEKEVRERMSLVPAETQVAPAQVINTKPLASALNSFFRTSQLSNIIDQTNILAELDNLRRITVAGPGGIEKERASFSIRDIAASQYGRICPIRSPEGPNIGVVTYMAMYGRVNKYGFLETPYRKVVAKGKKVFVTDEIEFLQADDEDKYYITSTNVHLDKDGSIKDESVVTRHMGDLAEVPSSKIQYIDISPRQAIGVAAALIPFLQNDDASRALMGTHMQCQGVPLIRPKAPLVGTGMELNVAAALGRTIKAPEDATVTYVDARKVTLKGKSGKEHEYKLDRFTRTNKDVCFDQRPRVDMKQKVKKGEVIVDGPGVDNGALALGQNLTIAYTSLHGYGYEDGFVISERLLKDDVFTSLTMEEFVADVVDTKLGPEELTRDIPNVREEVLANLDKEGYVVDGTMVKGGDILVGKVAPKGERELTAEERLLRAIFGEKAKDVKDTSLRVPYGKRGVVVNVETIDGQKDPNELEPSILKRVLVHSASLRKISVGDKLAGRHGNKGVIAKILPEYDMPYLEDGTPVDIIISPASILARMNMGQIFETILGKIAQKEGVQMSIPVFERLKEEFIIGELKKFGFPLDGKQKLFDGNSGQEFDRPVLTGVGYIMKLIHMVDDKFHARSVGPYSLVTQQPLGGKSQMGGQRFGEMEVWALEAHRVPHVLQEMLTLKSDDVRGRQKAFESIIKGVPIPQSSVPESFNVLVKELNALGLAVDYIGSETPSL
jgi:DNA-directed RNA polymerase subunit beta